MATISAGKPRTKTSGNDLPQSRIIKNASARIVHISADTAMKFTIFLAHSPLKTTPTIAKTGRGNA